MPVPNPFVPGSIVTTYMFAGRGSEISKLRKVLYQMQNGNAHNFLVQGERGIGKSSLLLLLDRIARGKGFPQADSFLVTYVTLENTNGYVDILRKMALALRRELQEIEPLRHFAESCWEFVKRCEAYGMKYSTQAPGEPYELLDELTTELVRISRKGSGVIRGILMLLDEADAPPADARLGALVKLLTEALVIRDCRNVCVGLAGVTGVLDTLAAGHESAPRILDVLTLKPLEPNESREILARGLEAANKVAPYSMHIRWKPEAERVIVDLSEGYPHFVQQFAYCAFDQARGTEITDADVWKGALLEHGALEQLGQKYFQEMHLFRVSSHDVRVVVDALARESETEGWRTRDQLASLTRLSRNRIDLALEPMLARKIVVGRQGVDGVVRLASNSFAAWVRSFNKGQVVRRVD